MHIESGREGFRGVTERKSLLVLLQEVIHSGDLLWSSLNSPLVAPKTPLDLLKTHTRSNFCRRVVLGKIRRENKGVRDDKGGLK